MLKIMSNFAPCYLNVQQSPNISNNSRKDPFLIAPMKKFRSRCSKRQQYLPTNRLHNCPKEVKTFRVFAVSDLHTDYSENLKWLKNISSSWYQNDVLIVAGDVAETYSNFLVAMSELKKRFGVVFFVPGNHDLWCRREDGAFPDSLEKLNTLLNACSDLGVETSPRVIEGLGIIPIYSWYHKSFDREKDVTGIRIPSLEMACKDFHACKWPQQLDEEMSLAHHFDMLNEKNNDIIEEIQRTSSDLITFSHFVPRQELCPEKRMLFYPDLPKIIGSDLLEVRLRNIHGKIGRASACHVFGHTHFCWDAVLDGVRYVQAPLAYPRERKRRMNGGDDWLPFCIYDNGRFTDGQQNSFWSDHYSKIIRDPDNTEPAPWVAKFYSR